MPAVGGALQERGEAGDVVAAADGDGADAVAARPLDRQIDGARREPDAGQRAAVPGHAAPRSATIAGLARRRHRAGGDLRR